MKNRHSVFHIGLLVTWAALCLLLPTHKAQAQMPNYARQIAEPRESNPNPNYSNKLSGFTMDDQLKSEFSLRGGLALPLGHIRLSPATEGCPAQGAGIGGMVGAAYHFYPIPQFFIGAHVDIHLLGFDFTGLFDESADHHIRSGWNSYSIAAVIGPRFQLGLYGLYFTAHIGFGYNIMTSPGLQSVHKIPAPTEKDPDRTRSVKHTLVSSYTLNNFYFTGGIGIEYRFRQHWIAKILFDYNYTPTTLWGSDQATRTKNEHAPIQPINLSVFAITVGASYAF